MNFFSVSLTSPMRILKVTQAYHPFLHRGGPAIKVRSIARGLVGLGHRVTVLTADLGLGTEEIASTGAVRHAQGWESALDGLETIYLTTRFRYRNLTVNPGVIPFCQRRLQEFDLVHVYGLYDTLGPAVARYCRKFGIPYLVEPLGMTRPIDRGFVLKKLWRKLTNGYLSGARTIITTSELERGELLAEGFASEQVLLRYNGIDLQEFRQLPPPGSFRKKYELEDDKRFVLFLGRIIPRKGADLLIEALPHLSDTRVKLVIAGPEAEDGYIALLFAKAKAMEVENRVLFVGPLYGAEKKAALADAAIFALPSRYENFGNAAAEAIACGTPVIVSDQCGIAPLIANRAGLVAPYQAAAVTDALNKLLANEPLYRQLKTNCAEVVEELSWTKLISDMEDAYRQVTDKPHSQLACI